MDVVTSNHHTKTGSVFVLMASLYTLLYMPQNDSQQYAYQPFLASAALKFISFILAQASAVFIILMFIHKSKVFRIVALITRLLGDVFMIIALITFHIQLHNYGKRQGISYPVYLNYKIGMLAISVVLGFIGSGFLLLSLFAVHRTQQSQTYNPSMNQQQPGVIHNHIQASADMAGIAPQLPDMNNQQYGTKADAPPVVIYTEPPSPYDHHTPVQTHYEY